MQKGEIIMCKIIAIANQKGGVGKTTTTSNWGVGLVTQGKKVLLIDADAQGSLTASLGYAEPDYANNAANIEADKQEAQQAQQQQEGG